MNHADLASSGQMFDPASRSSLLETFAFEELSLVLAQEFSTAVASAQGIQQQQWTPNPSVENFGKHFFQCFGKTAKTRSFILACRQAQTWSICLGEVPSQADSAANILRVSKSADGFHESCVFFGSCSSPLNAALVLILSSSPSLSNLVLNAAMAGMTMSSGSGSSI